MAAHNFRSTIPALERSLAFFRPHHLELRSRVIKVLVSITLCTIIAYFFAEHIAAIFITPLLNASPLVSKLVYTHLPEAFISYIKLALLVGTAASLPVLLYQMWVFIAPGLHKDEKRLVVTLVFWASFLFCCGAGFSFFIVLPKVLVYFMSYANPGLEPLPKFGKYLTFVARTLMTFGLSFQIPFLMVMAGKTGLVSGDTFRAQRRFFYLAIVIVSFLLAAGDFMATILLSFPLFGLYEAGVFLTSLFSQKNT